MLQAKDNLIWLGQDNMLFWGFMSLIQWFKRQRSNKRIWEKLWRKQTQQNCFSLMCLISCESHEPIAIMVWNVGLRTCVSAVTICTAAAGLQVQLDSAEAWLPSHLSSSMISPQVQENCKFWVAVVSVGVPPYPTSHWWWPGIGWADLCPAGFGVGFGVQAGEESGERLC